MKALDALRDDLRRLDLNGRRRSLVTRTGLDFASNDYLGLAGSSRLTEAVRKALDRGVAVGSGGSRLLRGNSEEHERLEEEAACFFGAESALFMATGYAANALLFSTLPQRGDLVIYDELVHASVHEGMRSGRADTEAFAHNDSEAAGRAIIAWRQRGGRGTPWIAVESLYSMDGDRAPLDALSAIAGQEGAMLVVDEAHATGIFGPGGRGLGAALDGRDNVVTLRTCGKALGCEGALILCPSIIREFLINRGRAFIFSTAPSPLMAAAVRTALQILHEEPDRRVRLQALLDHTAQQFARFGLPVTGAPIQPIVIGDDGKTMAIAAALRANGFDVRGVRPPAVPTGTSRLRLSITLNVDEDSISALTTSLGEML